VSGQVGPNFDRFQIISVNSNVIDIQKDLTAVKLSFVQDNLLSQHLSDYFLHPACPVKSFVLYLTGVGKQTC